MSNKICCVFRINACLIYQKCRWILKKSLQFISLGLYNLRYTEPIWCVCNKKKTFRYHIGLTVCRKNSTKINTKYSLYFFPTLRLHRITDVALRCIYICILFTANFDVFTFTRSKRSAKNTVLRTNQNSKWVPNFRKKRYSLMTEQFSVQYSTMQVSFIHMMLNIHIFWGS